MKKLICLVIMLIAVSLTACTKEDAVKNVQSDIASEPSEDLLSEDEIRKLLSELIPPTQTAQGLFNGASLVHDADEVIPGEENYVLVTDEKYRTIDSLKEAIAEHFTDESAEYWFYSHFTLRGDILPLYKEYNSRLYANSSTGGKGYGTEYLYETAVIEYQDESTITVLIDVTAVGEPYYDWSLTLKKENNKWKFDRILD